MNLFEYLGIFLSDLFKVISKNLFYQATLDYEMYENIYWYNNKIEIYISGSSSLYSQRCAKN